MNTERVSNIKVIQAAYHTLRKYFAGEVQVLQSLSPAVAGWLLFHEYIQEVLNDEGAIEFEVTEKASRAMTVLPALRPSVSSAPEL